MIFPKFLLFGLFATIQSTPYSSRSTWETRFTHLGTRRLEPTSSSPTRDFEEDNYYSSAFAGVWNNAVQDCKDTFGARGHLVSIEDVEESDAINKWLEDRGSGGATFWTSGQFVVDAGFWVWTGNNNGDVVEFTAWGPDQPIPSPNNRHRIALVHRNQFNAFWEARLDSDTLRYICEVDSTSPGSTTRDPTAPTLSTTSTPTAAPSTTSPTTIAPTTTTAPGTPSTTSPSTTTPTTTPPPIDETVPIPCNTTMDLVVILDSSGSIGLSNYLMLKQFVAKLAGGFTSHQDTLFGLVVYSEGVEIVVDLVNMSPEEITNRILNARYHAGPSPTDQGILTGTGMLQNTASRGMSQRFIVITDGISNEPEKTKEAAANANELGIETFALGISDNVGLDEILAIAGGHRDRMWLALDWDGLMEFIRMISVGLCPSLATEKVV